MTDWNGVAARWFLPALGVVPGVVTVALVAVNTDEPFAAAFEGAFALVLAAARTDYREVFEQVSLSAFARDAWESVQTTDATLNVTGAIAVAAAPSRLRQLLSNLSRTR